MRLPSVYANKIDKKIDNNTNYYHGENSFKNNKDISLLKSFFDNRGYVNRLSVSLVLKDGKRVDEKLVLCKNDCFVTLDNKKIYFDDIIDYEIKK